MLLLATIKAFMRSGLKMEVPSAAEVVPTVKFATAMSHIKNNRIELLLLLIVSHFLGITDIVISQIHGVC
jgi:hypothetical protein